MAPFRTKRIYNPLALETWFENVAFDWENAFSKETLQEGQNIYREGLISGLELDKEEAIVHCSFERKNTCYSVIEWGQTGPKVRSSTDNNQVGRAVAVAGLYEIEELIADEIPPLPVEGKKKPIEEKPSLSKEENENGVAPPNTQIEEKPIERSAIPAKSVQSRPLCPRFEGVSGGLRLDAEWIGENIQRQPALQQRQEKPVTELEREALVRLTGMARNAGFRYRTERNDFLLDDAEQIAAFLSRRLKAWRIAFGEIELDAEAKKMARGVRSIDLIGRVERANRETVRLDWSFRAGQQWLDADAVGKLIKAGKGAHVVQGIGLVQITDEQSETLADWQVSATDGDQTWPSYMIFSLFGQRGAKLKMDRELEDWQSSLASVEEDSEKELKLPEFLRAYQAFGVSWLANLRRHSCHGLLADEMGLGKTVQVLTLLHASPIKNKPSLIVCPASVVPVWQGEAKRWYPNLSTQILSSANLFSRTKEDSNPTLWIASYSQLRRQKQHLETTEFGYAVLDEAQQIKNPEAKVTQACCSIQAECRIALTGTPIENRLLDLWTLFRFLMPGLLGTRKRFETYCNEENREEKEAFEKRLRQQIAPFLLRRMKDKVSRELPPKMEIDLVCPITDRQRQAYSALLSKGREEMGDDFEEAVQGQTMNFLTLLTRLRQACCDPGLLPGYESEQSLEHSGKVQALMSHLEEALRQDGNRKVVVFSQFVQLLDRLKPLITERFPTTSLLSLTGHTRDRAKPVEEFQNETGSAIMLVSLRAGGTGITLNAADYVFLLDPWWNPAVENQAIDRVHRIGQKKQVFVYRMITQDTVEERIQQLKKQKRELFENTLGGLGEVSQLKTQVGDLKELARLLT
ncbi:MAG: DEAD/DEAH box helicase [Coraliomargaritaceae bacterium]